MEKEKQKKDQFIIAYIADFERPETVCSYSLYLAKMLNKGLILLHIFDNRHTTVTTEEGEIKLLELQRKLKETNPEIQITYCSLKGKTREIITALPVLLNAVVIVAQVDKHASRKSAMSRKNLLQNFSDCKTAYLVAQEPLRDESHMQDVATAIDFKKESKDKLIWSSYFPRFGGSRMHILYYDYKDEFLKNKWYANMKQLHKLYSSLNIKFIPEVIMTKSKSTYMDVNALKHAAQKGYGMLISVTTKEKDGLEFFIGVQDNHTIVNKEKIPILFINPREDLYVLCD
ncbi:MAG: hypothetical protein J5848_07345 [Bacteroidales bacterium]|nr:hypothetical protein [Bacteroidales bacterium]